MNQTLYAHMNKRNFKKTILQSHNNKNLMVLAQKQTGRPMDQKRRPKHKPTYLQPTDLPQRS
jgi:hypothetical protein